MKLLSAVWTVLYLVFGLANNVGVIMMGKRMEPYAEFLLYGTTMLYTICFAILSIVRGESWSLTRAHHINFAWLGLWTSINGVLAQFAIPFVSAELTNILVNVSIPCTWISAWYMFRFEVNVFRIVCCVGVLIGVLIGLVPSLFSGSGTGGDSQNPPLWIVVTVLSAIPTAFETTYQERAFKTLKAPLFVCLTMYNAYSLLVYFLTCPLIMVAALRPSNAAHGLSWQEVWENQALAFRCYFGGQFEPEVDGCEHGAILWTTVFTVGYVGMFGFGALLLRDESSSLIANLNALLIPLGAMIFWSAAICGDDSQQPVWWVGVSVVVTALMVVAFEMYDTKWLQRSQLGGWISTSCCGATVIPENKRFSSCRGTDEQQPMLNPETTTVYVSERTWQIGTRDK